MTFEEPDKNIEYCCKTFGGSWYEVLEGGFECVDPENDPATGPWLPQVPVPTEQAPPPPPPTGPMAPNVPPAQIG